MNMRYIHSKSNNRSLAAALMAAARVRARAAAAARPWAMETTGAD